MPDPTDTSALDNFLLGKPAAMPAGPDNSALDAFLLGNPKTAPNIMGAAAKAGAVAGGNNPLIAAARGGALGQGDVPSSMRAINPSEHMNEPGMGIGLLTMPRRPTTAPRRFDSARPGPGEAINNALWDGIARLGGDAKKAQSTPAGQAVRGAYDAAMGMFNPVSAIEGVGHQIQDPADAVNDLAGMVRRGTPLGWLLGDAPSDSVKQLAGDVTGVGLMGLAASHVATGLTDRIASRGRGAATPPPVIGHASTPESPSVTPHGSGVESWQDLLSNGTDSDARGWSELVSQNKERQAGNDALDAFILGKDHVETTKVAPKPVAPAKVAVPPIVPPVVPEAITPDVVAHEVSPTEPVASRTRPEPWQVSRETYAGKATAEARPFLEAVHEGSVRTALHAGEPVAPEVLADYPHLAEKAGRFPGAEALSKLAPDDERLDPFSDTYDKDLVRAAYKNFTGSDLPDAEAPHYDAIDRLKDMLGRQRQAEMPRDMSTEQSYLSDLKKLARSGTENLWRVTRNAKGDNTVDARSHTVFTSIEGLPREIQQAILDDAEANAPDHGYITDDQYTRWKTEGKPTLRGVRTLSEVARRNLGGDAFERGNGASPIDTDLDRVIVPRRLIGEYVKNLKAGIDANEALGKKSGAYPTDADLDHAKGLVLAPEPAAEVPPSETVGIYNAKQAKDVAAGLYKEPEKLPSITKEAIHAKGKDVGSLEQAESLGEAIRTKAESADSSDANLSRAKEGARQFRIAVDAAKEAEVKAVRSGDAAGAIAKRTVRQALEARQQKFLDNVQKGKGEWHRAGMALAQETRIDTGSYSDMVREAEIKKEAPLTEVEREAIKNATDDLRKLNERISAMEDAANSKLAAERFAHESRVRIRGERIDREVTTARIKSNASKLARLLLTPEHVGSGPADFFQKFPEARDLIGEIAKDVVRLGADSLEKMVAGVHEVLRAQGVKDLPDARSIHDAYSGYGKETEAKTPTEAVQRMGELKSLARIQSQIEDVMAGKESKTIAGRVKPSIVLDAARKQLADVRKAQTARNAKPGDPTMALQRRLERLVDTLENGPKEKATAAPKTPQMVNIENRIRETMGKIKEKYGPSEETQRAEDLQRQIDAANKEFSEGKKVAPPKAEGPPTAKIDALEKQLAAARKAVSDKYKADPEAAKLAKMQETYLRLESEYRTNTRASSIDKTGIDSSDMEAAKQQLRDMKRLHDTQDQINELDRRMREGDFFKPSKAVGDSFKELDDLRDTRNRKAKDLRDAIEDARPKTPGERIARGLLGWQRFGLISSPTTALKVAFSNLSTALTRPFEETQNPVVKPVIKALTGTSPGPETAGSFRAEKAAAGEFLQPKKMLVEGHARAAKGADALDLLADEMGLKVAHHKPSVLGVAGTYLHAMAAEPVKLSEFARQMVKSTDVAQKAGLDPADPKTHAAIFAEAYNASMRATLLNENLVSNQLKSAKSSLRNQGAIGKALASVLDAAVPLPQLPFNAAGRVLEYTPGLSHGYVLGRSVIERAFTEKTVENPTRALSPESAQGLARALKRGNVGLAVSVAAGLLPQLSVDKKGELLWNGQTVRWLSHSPLLSPVRVGVLLRQATGEWWKNIPGAVESGTKEALRSAPLVNDMTQVTQAMQSGDLSGMAGAKARQVLEPTWLQQAARYADPASPKQSLFDAMFNGTPEVRRAKGFADQLKIGAPVVRESVPLKKAASSKPPTEASLLRSMLGKH